MQETNPFPTLDLGDLVKETVEALYTKTIAQVDFRLQRCYAMRAIVTAPWLRERHEQKAQEMEILLSHLQGIKSAEPPTQFLWETMLGVTRCLDQHDNGQVVWWGHLAGGGL